MREEFVIVKLRALAVTTAMRSPVLGEPNLPMPFPVLQAAAPTVITAHISIAQSIWNVSAHL